jgi:hypothetical protein
MVKMQGHLTGIYRYMAIIGARLSFLEVGSQRKVFRLEIIIQLGAAIFSNEVPF